MTDVADGQCSTTDNAMVTIDGTLLFPCLDEGHRWNGFVCPAFRRPVAEAIVAALQAEQECEADPDGLSLRWDGDAIVVAALNHAATPGYEPDRVVPRADGRYTLGARDWTWTMVAIGQE